MIPKSNKCSKRDRDEKTQIQRRKPCEEEGRAWSYAATRQRSQEPPAAGRSHQKDSPLECQAEGRPANTLILDSVIEYIFAVLFKPLIVW